MGIDRCGAEKFETPFFQVASKRIRFLCFDRNLLGKLPTIRYRFSTYKLPAVLIEAPKFFLNLNKSLGVIDGGFDFLAISNDSRVQQKSGHFLAVKSGHFDWIKVCKGLSVVLSFIENR